MSPGMTFFGPEIAAKRLELLRETLPRIQRVAVLSNSQNAAAEKDPTRAATFARIATAAKLLKLEVQHFGVKEREDFERAFAAMAKGRAEAVMAIDEPVITINATLISDLAKKYRLPLIAAVAMPAAGGLMGYGTNLVELFHRSATYVDKILKGAKPGDLPVEQPTKFELVVNLKTVRVLGIKIPQAILVRVDKVIE